MKHKEDFMAAYGAPDDGFNCAVDAALDGIRAKETQPIMKKKLSVGLLAAIIAILALTGAALAVSGSGILQRIFTATSPDERAEKAVMHVEASDSSPYGTLTVTDYVMDGEDLYVDWTFETDSEENLVIQGDLLLFGTDAGLSNEMSLGSGEAIVEDTAVDLRECAAQTRRMKDGRYSAMSHAYIDGGVPTEPFDVVRTMYIVRPLADVARISSPDEGYYDDGGVEVDGWPMPIHLVNRDRIYLQASMDWFSEEELAVGEMAWINTQMYWGPTRYLDEDGNEVLGEPEPIRGEVVAKLEARFTVDPAAIPNYTVALSEPRHYGVGDFDLTVTRCEFTGFSARIEYELRPRIAMNKGELEMFSRLRVRLPDGTTPTLESVHNITSEGTVRGIMTSGGGFTATPDYIELIPLQYVPRENEPGFFDPLPHEEKAVTVPLTPVRRE